MRRIVHRLGIALLLGVLTTFIVGWCCGVWAHVDPMRTRGMTFFGGGPLAGAPSGQLGVHHVSGPAIDTLAVTSSLRAEHDHLSGVFDTTMVDFDEADQARAIDAVISGSAFSMWCAYGWPTLAVECHRDVDGMHGGFQLRDDDLMALTGTIDPFPRAIAWRPVWPGFAVNAVMFSGAWAVLFIGPLLMRRSLRRRRGRCMNCGYDLRATPTGPCPECGRAVSLRQA